MVLLKLLKESILLKSSSSPRRVAVPVLVKDGKPCSGGSANQTATSTASSDTSRTQQSPACQPTQQQSQCMANSGLAMAYRQQGNYQQQCGGYLPLQTRAW
ncbi:hypothetical protein JTB14_012056 [Gonioctena quinquepunctata]|nr:hypothetical protein JTB14_012056 [Gonioctena quinquepunctata]